MSEPAPRIVTGQRIDRAEEFLAAIRHIMMSIERYDAMRRAYDAVLGKGATITHGPPRIKT